MPNFQKYGALLKPNYKNLTQTIFQGGSPWATLIHNSVVCLGGTLLCPDASWGDVFSKNPFTFSFAKVFLLLPKNFLNYFLSFEILRNAQFPKIYDTLLKPN